MNAKQKQCLLAFFGCYDGKPDGIWGPKSRQGTGEFQERTGLTKDCIFGSKTEAMARKMIGEGADELPEPEEAVGWWSEIRHFKPSDFRCKCGGKYCDGYPAQMQQAVVKIVDDAVTHFGKPFDPALDMVSGLRCRIHNANQGGVANSQHMYGEAIDFRIRGVSGAELLAWVKTRKPRYAYIIGGTDNVHVDIPKGKR